MQRQSIALVHGQPRSGYVGGVYRRPEFAGPVPQKNLSQIDFFAAGKQIHAGVLPAYVDFPHADLYFALAAPAFQFGKPDIFSFDPAFVGI